MQSQDAYGSDQPVTIGGATLPVPDLAVGRLVKTPGEIEATIDNFLTARERRRCPGPTPPGHRLRLPGRRGRRRERGVRGRAARDGAAPTR